MNKINHPSTCRQQKYGVYGIKVKDYLPGIIKWQWTLSMDNTQHSTRTNDITENFGHTRISTGIV